MICKKSPSHLVNLDYVYISINVNLEYMFQKMGRDTWTSTLLHCNRWAWLWAV